MLKVGLAVFGCFVAAVWIVCGYLYFGPADEGVSPGVASSPVSSIRRDSPAATPPTPGPRAPSVAPAPGDPAASNVAVGVLPPSVPGAEADVQRGTEPPAAARDAPLPKTATAPATKSPQYTASGGYVLDGDSVVIAPPTSADGPNSAAEQRRRTRLTTDISKIP